MACAIGAAAAVCVTDREQAAGTLGALSPDFYPFLPCARLLRKHHTHTIRSDGITQTAPAVTHSLWLALPLFSIPVEGMESTAADVSHRLELHFPPSSAHDRASAQVAGALAARFRDNIRSKHDGLHRRKPPPHLHTQPSHQLTW